MTESAGRLRALAPLGAGLVALAVGTAFGWDARIIGAIVTPPPIMRAALVGASAVLALALLVMALRRMGAGDGGSTAARPDLPTMVRGIRLVFLAVAAAAAGFGWALAHPLPIVIALVIAGVDVIETSFLLLVVRRRD